MRDAGTPPDVVPLRHEKTDENNRGPAVGACPGSRHEGVDAMGRGRQKAKQTKVARQLKYFSPETDYERLQRELASSNGHRDADSVEADLDDEDSDAADEEEDDDEEEEDETDAYANWAREHPR